MLKQIRIISLYILFILMFSFPCDLKSTAETSTINNDFFDGLAALLSGVNPRVSEISKKIMSQSVVHDDAILVQPALHEKLEVTKSLKINDASSSEVAGASGFCMLKGIIDIHDNIVKKNILPIIRVNDKVVIGFAVKSNVFGRDDIKSLSGYYWCSEGKINEIAIALIDIN